MTSAHAIARFTSPLRRFLHWFTAPGPTLPLAVFRILMALFCLFKLWAIRDSIFDIYGEYGFVQWAITRATLDSSLPHLGNITLWLARWQVTPHGTVVLVLGVYCTALCLVAAGILTRSVALLAWLLELIMMHTGAGTLYGMDYFTHIGLFYLVIMPSSDRLSLPVALGRRPRYQTVSAGVTRRMLQLQMALIYGSSGIEKSLGPQWWNGEAIWRSMTLPVFHVFDLTWLASVPWLPMMIGWSVLLTEGGYLVAMWFRRTRLPWFCAIVGMHLGIGLFMGMWVFAAVMITLNIGAFGAEVWHDAVGLYRNAVSHRHGDKLTANEPELGMVPAQQSA